MKLLKAIALGLPVALTLPACQSVRSDFTVSASERIQHGANDSESLLAIARYYQFQLRPQQAAEAYRRLLAADPRHAAGHNGLAILFADLGRYDEAIDEFRNAVALAPDSVSFRNNLGYALMLAGKNGEAVSVLRSAAQLDPEHVRVRENLELALARREAIEPVTEGGAVDAEREEQSAEASPAQAPAGANELPLVHQEAVALSARSETKASLLLEAAPPAGPALRLEIANANGFGGLARAMSRTLPSQYQRARLTNAMPYRVLPSEIQYRPGYEAEAQRLQRQLEVDIPLVSSSALRSDIKLRLVLGKDASLLPAVERLFAYQSATTVARR